MRKILLLIAVPLFTLFFGTLAIAGCLIVRTGNPLIWLARPWARCILLVAGTRIRVKGRDGVPSGRPVLYVTNHQSHFDVLALVRALPGQYRIVAKQELFRIPVFGWAIALAGFIKIDRADREKAFRSLDLAAEKIRSGTSVVIFAEGTRSPDGSLLPFKKGGFVLAVKSRCPIVPVSISGSRAVLSKSSLNVRRGAIDVVLGRPIDTATYTLETKDALMKRVREAIEAGYTELRERDLEPGRTCSRQPAPGV